MTPIDSEELQRRAIRRAEAWQQRANALMTREERRIQSRLRRLLGRPLDKAILTTLIDQSFRTGNSRRVADQVAYLLRRDGIPRFFAPHEKLLMRLFLWVAPLVPWLAVPQMISRMRRDSRRAIIDGAREPLHAHLERRKGQGVRMNINHLGEAVLGEGEAEHRLETYIHDLEDPAIEVISVKISTIYSQISSLAFEHTVAVLQERLGRLYAAAQANRHQRCDGSSVTKFVNLDMEEYRDLEITTAAFRRTLEEERFRGHAAGIVLQAYLPDAFAIQRQLTAWAMARVAAGGAPIKIRIVKGANMEMEQLEAALYNWPLAPYDTKREVDANFKRMVAFGLQPEHAAAVRLGIASHNLFELAYAHELAEHRGLGEAVTFEMLEGMANHVRRALSETKRDVLMYAPVAGREEFINAVAYLVRRLDENTGEENFLRYAPELAPASPQWERLREGFQRSCRLVDSVQDHPNRSQDRGRETFAPETGSANSGEFRNAADTDWSLPANRRWAEGIRSRWRRAPSDAPEEIPLVIAGREVWQERRLAECHDPNRQPERILLARYRLGSEADVEAAVAAAKADPDGWRRLAPAERHRRLCAVAAELARARGDLIGAAAANTGKLFGEADVEVSEAIDFAEYYPLTACAFSAIPTLEASGRGVGAVISPWNFPIAIPCGGIVAALAAGNTVIFKPASDAVLVGWRLCQAFWQAGIGRNTLQFLPCAGGDAGARLSAHPDIDFVILTGGTATGLAMLQQRPDLLLAAETGGKNATIVTAMADRDQAIKNVVASAYGNSGQKCSATSLLVLEREIYDDPRFKRQLVDAARSWAVGSAWEFHNRMGALIRPPAGDLLRALTTLEPGESWALEPRPVGRNPHMWSPGIKWGVKPGSFTHLTEFFGPLLGVMRADDLAQAVDMVNGTGYGLTSGLESLDRREQKFWMARVRAGNLYINRGTTGAITLRQPFGGMGKSAIGPAIKAGSPNYVTQFMQFREHAAPLAGPLEGEHPLLRVVQEWRLKLHSPRLAPWAADLERTIRAVQSYLYHFEREFGRSLDYFHLRGQDNLLRYRPLGAILVRVHPADALFDVLARIAAARIAGSVPLLSLPPGLENGVTAFLERMEARQLLGRSPLRRQTDGELIATLPLVDRVRYAAPERVPAAVLEAAARSGLYIARAPVLMEGRIELLHYTLNQSVCRNYHRYGNLGQRGLPDSGREGVERRAPQWRFRWYRRPA
jgi:RHH-type proline utilization regulon transcriptional repressor/proline dehydrogenase/delta 1-pyrroline-5-carboxylate dehydrogenase